MSTIRDKFFSFLDSLQEPIDNETPSNTATDNSKSTVASREVEQANTISDTAQQEQINTLQKEIATLKNALKEAQLTNIKLATQTDLGGEKQSVSEILRGEEYHPLFKGGK